MTIRRIVVDFGTCDHCGGRMVVADHIEPWSTYLNEGIGMMLACQRCDEDGAQIDVVSTWFDANYPESEAS